MANAANVVGPKGLISTLLIALKTMRPVFVWGPPGVGKSNIVRQFADAVFNAVGKLHVRSYFVDIRAMLLDPVDLRGIPSVENKRTGWNPPAFLPVVGMQVPGAPDGVVYAEKGVINIDELSQCDPDIQSALLQLVLDRQLGEYVLPEGWYIVACGNRISDGTFSKKLSKALGSRFGAHVDLEINSKDWAEWAVGAHIHPSVLGYIRWKPENLHQFDAKSADNTFPCPRTWEFVSDFMHAGIGNDVMLPVLSGCIGTAYATEFVGYMRIYSQLPDIDDILKRPDSVDVPTEPAAKYALCGALARHTNQSTAANVFKYMKKLSVEMQVVWLRDTLQIDNSVTDTPEFTDWIVANGDLLN